MKNNAMQVIGQHVFGPYLIRYYRLQQGTMLLKQPVTFAVQAFLECDADDEFEALIEFNGRFYATSEQESVEPCSPVYAMSGNDLDELIVGAEQAVAEMA